MVQQSCGGHGKWQDKCTCSTELRNNSVSTNNLEFIYLQFVNVASGANLRVGGELQSCLNIVQIAQSFILNGQSITLIDTPGFDDTTKGDSDTLRMISVFLATK
jgi:hypothetical protein